MEIEVQVKAGDISGWIKEKEFKGFRICFPFPNIKDPLKSLSKNRIMLQSNNNRFFTLAEIEKEIGKPIFTVVIV